MAPNPVSDIINRDTTPLSVPHTIIDGEQDDQDDEDDEDVTPGAVWVAGMTSTYHKHEQEQSDLGEVEEDVTPGEVQVADISSTGREHERTFATCASIPTTPTEQEKLPGVSDGNVVTAKATDNAEAVFDTEDVELLDNSARHNRMVIYYALVSWRNGCDCRRVAWCSLTRGGDDATSPLISDGDP